MRYGVFSAKGTPSAFYDDALHETVPPEAVALTDAQYQELIQNAGLRRYVAGRIVVYDPASDASLKPAVPRQISRRQFWQQLAVLGRVTEAEAIAAVTTGSLPAALNPWLDALPASDAFAARMLLAGASTYQRDHALTEQIRAAMSWSVDELDGFWRAASQL